MKKNKLQITKYALLTLAFALAFAILIFQPAFAQGSTPSDDDVNAVASQLYCPVCESTPLDVCPTEACRQWRDLIRQQLADGMTEDQIKQYFVENYGARVLAEPPKQGSYWLFYFLPPIIILAGAFILLRSMKAWTKPIVAEPTHSAARSEPLAKDEYISQFEEESKKRK